MAVLTIYTIFSIDCEKAFFSVKASLIFSTIHLAAIGFYTAEIIINSIAINNYMFRFYFWVDIFSTLTMILELFWIENLMSDSSDVAVALSFAKVTKASRLSKIAARLSKIMKLIRLIRLISIFQSEE